MTASSEKRRCLPSVMPMLASRDLERTRRFYEHLGFRVTREKEFSFQVERHGVELYFGETDTDYSSPEYYIYSRACAVRVANVAEWHEAFSKSRTRWKILYPSLTSISEAAWGAPAFAITDRDANLIWFVEDSAESTA